MLTLKQIADGGPFDQTEAIRLLATNLLRVHPGLDPDFYEEGQTKALEDAFGSRVADTLYKAGFATPEAVFTATDEELLAVDGIGPNTLKKLREAKK